MTDTNTEETFDGFICDKDGCNKFIKKETFESKLNELEIKYLNHSFICEDKKIHFGKLHVCYVRDIQEFSKEVKQLHDQAITKLKNSHFECQSSLHKQLSEIQIWIHEKNDKLKEKDKEIEDIKELNRPNNWLLDQQKQKISELQAEIKLLREERDNI